MADTTEHRAPPGIGLTRAERAARLRTAAAAIDRALDGLDTRKRGCASCAATTIVNYAENAIDNDFKHARSRLIFWAILLEQNPTQPTASITKGDINQHKERR